MPHLRSRREIYIPLIQTRLDIHQNTVYQYIMQICAHKTIADLVEESISRCTAGKKIRGLLSLIGHEISGGKIPDSLIDLACAIEIFQTSILIHDDIIDQSDVRRGQQTIHSKLGGIYGIGQAICVGDIGFFIANNLLTRLDLPPSVIIRLIQMFNDMVISTGTGEMLDIYLPTSNQIDQQAINTVMLLKTARYTISYPLMMGALTGLSDIASAESGEYLDGLREFGDAAGIAFQIMDDIDGLYGNEIDLGKSTNSDILEGKKTLLWYYAMQHGSMQDQQLLSDRYGRTDCDQSRIQEIRGCFDRCGAREYAYIQSREYLQKACQIIDSLPIIDDQGRELLREVLILVGR